MERYPGSPEPRNTTVTPYNKPHPRDLLQGEKPGEWLTLLRLRSSRKLNRRQGLYGVSWGWGGTFQDEVFQGGLSGISSPELGQGLGPAVSTLPWSVGDTWQLEVLSR